jgi:hypothetical protein
MELFIRYSRAASFPVIFKLLLSLYPFPNTPSDVMKLIVQSNHYKIKNNFPKYLKASSIKFSKTVNKIHKNLAYYDQSFSVYLPLK